MRRKLLALNLALLAAIVLVAARVRQTWVEARQREAVVLGQPLKHLPAPPYAPLPRVTPLAAADYSNVAQGMLFSADRNPAVVVEVVAPPPIPALPLFYGVMNVGDGLTAIMSQRSGAVHQKVRPGEKVGDFKLVALTTDDLVLEWEGQRVTKKLEELRDRKEAEAQNAARTAAQNPAQSGAQEPVRTAAPPSAASPATVISPASSSGPMGAPLGGDFYGCQPDDTSPNGTVSNGHKKVVYANPFGTSCKWAPVK